MRNAVTYTWYKASARWDAVPEIRAKDVLQAQHFHCKFAARYRCATLQAVRDASIGLAFPTMLLYIPGEGYRPMAPLDTAQSQQDKIVLEAVFQDFGLLHHRVDVSHST